MFPEVRVSRFGLYTNIIPSRSRTRKCYNYLMRKQVVVIHGYMGHPQSNWFPWLKAELEKQNIEVVVPHMPDPAWPTMETWVQTVQNIVGTLDNQTILVGHSLGGTTLLRYLEIIEKPQRAAGTVLVASPILPPKALHLRGVKRSFFATAFDFTKIRQAAGEVCAIYSEDDPIVSIASGHILRDSLVDTYVEIPDGGHLNRKSGYTTFPLVLEKIMQVYQSRQTTSPSTDAPL